MHNKNIADYDSYKTGIVRKISTIYVLISMFVCLLYSISFILIDAKLAGFVQLISGLSFMIIAGFMYQEKFKFTRQFALMTSIGSVLYQSVFYFGKSFGFHYQLFALIVVIYLLFNQNEMIEKINIFFFTVLVMVVFFVCQLSTVEPIYKSTFDYSNIYFSTATFFTFIGLSIVLYYFSVEIFKTKDQLYELATTDELTGLYNRRTFKNKGNDIFKIAQLGGPSFTIILFDIDSFKTVNDEYGHIIGDLVLSQISKRSSEALRKCDFLSRYGGEEFGVILENTTLEDCLVVAEKLRTHIESYDMYINTHKITRTISLGISEFRYEVKSFDDLIDEADKAMYTSKEKGKNTITVYNDKNAVNKIKDELIYKSIYSTNT